MDSANNDAGAQMPACHPALYTTFHATPRARGRIPKVGRAKRHSLPALCAAATVAVAPRAPARMGRIFAPRAPAQMGRIAKRTTHSSSFNGYEARTVAVAVRGPAATSRSISPRWRCRRVRRRTGVVHLRYGDPCARPLHPPRLQSELLPKSPAVPAQAKKLCNSANKRREVFDQRHRPKTYAVSSNL